MRRSGRKWVSLFAIDQLDGYSAPLPVDFLKANDKLLIDTALFDEGLPDNLISAIQKFGQPDKWNISVR